MSARPFETHNYAANAAPRPPAFNLKLIFKLQTSASEMTRAARFCKIGWRRPCPR
jgi:hypothetical protein